jgi:DNA-directed RNA polymerase subunit RPC12/RpoP
MKPLNLDSMSLEEGDIEVKEIQFEEERIVVNEIWCHECGKTIRFELNMSKNGNHVIKCPECGHEHCRVVKNGEITGERWDQRNGNTYYVGGAYVTSNSVDSMYYATSSMNSYFLRDSWNTVTTAGSI